MKTQLARLIGRSRIILSFTLLAYIMATLKPESSSAQQEYASVQRNLIFCSSNDDTGLRSEPVLVVSDRTTRRTGLTWIGLDENVSQYIIERSFDGEHFMEVSAVAASEAQKLKEFNYTDKFKASYSGRVYYRLKVVYAEGGAEYSPVTILPGYNLQTL